MVDASKLVSYLFTGYIPDIVLSNYVIFFHKMNVIQQ